METPFLDHISRADYDTVYEPAEDSFLLIDALEKELGALRKRSPIICLEVGCGSGVVSTALAKALGSTGCYFLATDINPKAAEVTRQTAQRNGVHVEVVVTDLVSSLLPRLYRQVDVLIFNPPYVVTSTEERKNGELLTKSWAGGERGREVIDRMTPMVPELLAGSGLYFLVVLKENEPDEIRDQMAEKGLESEVVLSRKCGTEHLSVLCFRRNGRERKEASRHYL